MIPAATDQTQYSVMTKKKLAEKLKVSVRTLRYWLNEKYFEELKEMGYQKSQKIITRKQYSYLHEKLVITPDE